MEFGTEDCGVRMEIGNRVVLRLGIWIRDWGLGTGDWDLELELGIWNLDWGLRLRLGIEIGNLD